MTRSTPPRTSSGSSKVAVNWIATRGCSDNSVTVPGSLTFVDGDGDGNIVGAAGRVGGGYFDGVGAGCFIVQGGLGLQLTRRGDNVEEGQVAGFQGVGQGVALGVGCRDGFADGDARRCVLVHVATPGLSGREFRAGSFVPTGAACTRPGKTAWALLLAASPLV